MYFRMKVAILLWELAHMELHLSEHLAASGNSIAPLTTMTPHFGWSTCTKDTEFISVMREWMLQQMTLQSKEQNSYYGLINATMTTYIPFMQTVSIPHLRVRMGRCWKISRSAEIIFIKWCIVSTWMDWMGLLGKVPDTWPCHCQPCIAHRQAGGHGNVPFLLRKAFSNRGVQWLEWARTEVLGSVLGRGAAQQGGSSSPWELLFWHIFHFLAIFGT